MPLSTAGELISSLFESPFSACIPTVSTSPLSNVDDSVVVNEECIPTGRTVYFDNWTRPAALPSAEQVRAASKGQNLLKKHVSSRGQTVVTFPRLCLVVKYGTISTMPISEGQTLWLLSHVPSIRVPKVYGWCEDGNERFIYMEHVGGVTVEKRWPSLSTPEKLAVAEQLNLMISSMRCLKQTPGNKYVGALHRGHIFEQVWNGRDSPVGPFDSVKKFTDALFALGRNLPGYPDHPFIQALRAAFSDDAAIVFTHTDLHPSNIMMSDTGSDVLGIIDWKESGWYPEHWEHVKALANLNWENAEDWEVYIRMSIQPAYDDELEAFIQFEQTGCLI